jgi:hypothetical protein
VLQVTDAQPGETVRFLYSLNEPGNGLGQPNLGGITLDILNAKQLGSAIADQTGTATLTRTIPANAPLRNVTLQAVIRRGQNGQDSVKTPFKTTRIQE